MYNVINVQVYSDSCGKRVRNRMAEVGKSVNMTSEVGVSFHSDNYSAKQISTGQTEQLIYNPRFTLYYD